LRFDEEYDEEANKWLTPCPSECAHFFYDGAMADKGSFFTKG
jgi:hypothetical protein